MLQVGAAMPDFGYSDASGRARRLSDAWAAGPAWILWLRHCGCQFYREAAIDLRETSAEFARRGLTRACVVQGTPEEAAALCEADEACENCVPDPERRSFETAGLGRARVSEVLFPSADLKARRSQARARGAKQDWKRTFAPGNDSLQLPGAALVDRSGTIRYVHAGTHTGDLPSAGELLRIADATL
jgi:hypothetical protein